MVGIEGGDSLPLVGDAVLTYNGGATIDAAFTDIQYLEGDIEFRAGAPYSTPNVRFENVPVSADGTYGSGTAGNRIQGGFYGPGHAEAAGIFERERIVGSFGAKRP